MGDIAIQFENVGKLYQLGSVGTGSLSHDFNRWWKMKILHREDPNLKIGETNDRTTKGASDFVWALRDIAFSIEQGDVVGIIGNNGAGKSTLLKLLSRVTAPTTGVIRAKGRIASLLEVGTGFHPEMTGRENIYMNGSIMGMTRQEITRKLDEIVDFAGVERYIDTPTKRYSSGMMVRLGFAVAAFLEPEILVVDEVLAVGDAEFQKRAIGKMQDVANGEGRTVLFVSHNMAAVRALCRSGIVLDKGRVSYTGSTDEAISHYLMKSKDSATGDRIADRIGYLKPGLRIESINVNGSEDSTATIVANQKTLKVSIKGYCDEPLTTDLMMTFKTKDNIIMAILAEGHYKGMLMKFCKGEFEIERTVILPSFISRGTYHVDLMLHHPMVEWQMKASDCLTIDVQGSQTGTGAALNLADSGFVGLETMENS